MEHPTPAVHYVLGFNRTFDLMNSYDPMEIDKTLAHTGTAKTQMPDNVRAAWFDTLAHLAAADIRKLEGNTALHEYHLSRARQNAAYLLEKHADAADSHFVNATLAEYEGRWEDALAHLRNGTDRPGGWPGTRLRVWAILYRLGQREEALAELDALADGLKRSTWARDRAFIVAELEGTDAAEATWRNWLASRGDRVLRHSLPYHAVYCFLGRREDAIRLSRENVKLLERPPDEGSFGAAMDQYVCGWLSEDGLLAAATSRGEKSAAHHWVGLSRLADGDRKGAMEHFTAVTALGNYTFSAEWPELLSRRLRDDPTWPPWIPLKEDTTTQPATEPTGQDP